MFLPRVFLLKWYIEEETKELRKAFEEEILNWNQVTLKKMFAGMVTKGIVITKLSILEREEIEKSRKTKPFVVGDKIIRSWVTVKLVPKDVTGIMSYVKKSYERAAAFGK